MQALTVEPGVAHSTRVEEVAEPAGDGVRVRVLEVGVCGTDREISEGLFGVSTGDRLVMGHEMLGVVDADGHGFSRGDLVSATVRRSCGHCLACAEGAPDSCLTGDYIERGITKLDGFAREIVVEDPAQLVAIPRELGRLGVLAEPMSICARGVRHALAIGNRQPWEPKRALVTGAGAVGLLTTLLLRQHGFAVTVVSLEESSPIADALGARYAQEPDGTFDLVFEAAGDAQLMANGLGFLKRSGVVCLLGIDARERTVQLDGRVIGLDTVLENRVLFGSVNANHEDWNAGVAALARADRGLLEQLVALRVPLDRFEEAFAFHGGKATLVVSDG
ncbi:MAG TPA: alcohol dehydrogenase catalytic domain-containing protein [Gaiellaceae bacterium]|nr:alcohol dehydrogenase catalytic domain-containing protein [Gaiellaceae bacterium]